MKIEFSFWVENRALPTNEICVAAYVSDKSAYTAIQDIAFECLSAPLPRRAYLKIQAFEGDPSLERILKLLGDAGWKPYLGEDVPEKLRATHFAVSRFRRYEKRDKDKCDYLRVSRWSLGEDLFDFDSVRDGLYCANVKGARWKARYGFGYNQHITSAYFVNGEFKQTLEAENLRGLAFKPVLFDKPEKARGEFWQLTSTVTMPPCLLPVLTIPSTPCPVLCYDDAGRSPLELVYEEAAVRQIEPFDIALTRERLSDQPDAWAHLFVVSQRFRHLAHKLRLSTVDFAPVRLR